jgi:prepilin-type N-terminal cleavage/methylation domain-containing protein
MKRNKGFSLVELIIAMAIVAVVGSLIVGFLLFSTKHFGSGSSEASLQENSQMLFGQLENYLIDANASVCYYVNPADTGDGTSVLRDDRYTGPEKSFASKRLEIYKTSDTGTTAEVITWTSSTKKLTYSKNQVDSSGNIIHTNGDTQLLAEHIESFAVDLTELETSSKVTFSVTLSNQAKTYGADRIVSLRNRVLANQKKTPEKAAVVSPTVLSVRVSPDTVTMNKGDSQRFKASVRGDNYPSQEVSWSINGSNSSATSIDTTGTLFIANNETSPSIQVIATAVDDRTKTGKADVTIQNAVTYTLTVSPDAATVIPGTGIKLTATVTGSDGYKYSNAQFSWKEDTTTTGYGSFSTATGDNTTYTVNGNASRGKIIKVNVSAKLNGTDIGTKTAQIKTGIDFAKYPLIETQVFDISGGTYTFVGDNLITDDGKYNIHIHQLTGQQLGGNIVIQNSNNTSRVVLQSGPDANGVYKSANQKLFDNCIKSDVVETIDLTTGINKMIAQADGLGNVAYLSKNYMDINGSPWGYYRQDYATYSNYVIYAKQGKIVNGQTLTGALTLESNQSFANKLIVADGNITIQGSGFRTDTTGVILYSKNGNITMNCDVNEFTGIIYAPNGKIQFNGGKFIVNGFLFAGTASNYNQNLASHVAITNTFTIKQNQTAINILKNLVEGN